MGNKFRNVWLLSAVTAMSTGLVSCGNTQSSASNAKTTATDNLDYVAKMTLRNPSKFARNDEITYFSFPALGIDSRVPLAKNLAVYNQNNQLVPSQAIDMDQNGEIDHLAILNQFAVGQSHELVIKKATQAANFEKRTQGDLAHKVGGEWKGSKYIGGEFKNVTKLVVPEQYTDHGEYIRYEGIGIESDKVGYRIYLDWRNGFDIFGKTKDEISLHKVGLDGYKSYHEMQDWGMDILKVGKSLGMGGYGYWNGSEVERVSKVDNWQAQIVDNGPIYSSIQINYKGWQVNEQKVDLTAKMAMTAGSRLVKVDLSTTEKVDDLAIGLVKHKGTQWIQGETDIQGTAWVYFASYGQQSLNNDNLGMALFIKKMNIKEITQDKNNYVIVSKSNSKDLSYYFAAAWDKEPNGVTSLADFETYLKQTSERLTRTIRVNKTTALAAKENAMPLTSARALDVAKRLADSELRRKAYDYVNGGYDKMRHRPSKYTYTTGLLAMSFDDLYQATLDPRYRQAAQTIVGSFIAEDGKIITYKKSDFNIDKINSGKMILRLYEQTGEEKYRIAAGHLRDQLKDHPKTSNGAFWHKKIYPHQLWLDGVYMGMPFLAQYSALFEDGASFDEVIHEFEVSREYLRDPNTGLYFHGWDESKSIYWANPETGLSQEFWARGMGWLAMASVDVLDFLPADDKENRKKLLHIIEEFAADLVKFQDEESGTWYQIPNKPNEIGNYKESSATAMYTYFLAKAVNKGYLPKKYKANAIKAYQGMLDVFVEPHPDGSVSLTNMCFVAGLGFGRDGSYNYYMDEPVLADDPKGTGPFIMASAQIATLLDK